MSWEARGEIIRQFILEHAEEFPKDLTKKTQEHFGISRQAVNLHVRKLVESGLLTVTGSTRARRYALRVVTDESFALPLSLSLQESYVWDVWVKPQLGTLPDNVVNIWHHGVTEMVNNAIDHSGGDKLVIRIIRTAVTSSMMINDNGEGIFHKIQREFGLYDPRHAILELAKGKLTTDPAHHSGEGIFFTSRAFDEFTILSGGLYFSHTAQHDADWLINGGTDDRGTMVVLKLYNQSPRTLREIFNRFASEESDYGFTKTIVPVRLAQHEGERLLSRSQAKRLVARFEKFLVFYQFGGPYVDAPWQLRPNML